jgi:NitT/TauT family transport system permease protein
VATLTGLLPAATAFLCVLAMWQLLNGVGVFKPFILPAPLAIIAAMLKVLPVIPDHTITTVVEALLGFAIGNLVAIVVTVIFVHNRASAISQNVSLVDVATYW